MRESTDMRMRNRRLRKAFVSASATVLLVIASTVFSIGQSSDSPTTSLSPDATVSRPDGSHTLDYRRVFFPRHLFSEMPMTGRYPHISAEVFHRLMDAARQSDEHAGEFDDRHILESLELSARLENQQLVAGQGVMRIGTVRPTRENRGNDTPVGTSSLPVTLAPFRLAVSNPVWNNGESAKLGPRGNGDIVLHVPPGADELTFDWTLQGGTDSRNDLIFSLGLPRFLRTHLTLDLPVDQKPIVPSGIIRRDVPRDEGGSPDPTDVPEGFRRWHITVGGSQALRLIVAPDETDEKFLHGIGVFERHSFDLSIYGMQLNTHFFLEKSDFVLNELTLELDEPLSPLSVKSDDRVLPWTVIPGEEGRPTRLLVSIPYLESGIRKIQVETFCPIQTDRLWELPRVRVCSPLFFWNETQNIVHVGRPLLTRRIESSQQRLGVYSSGTGETEGDLFVFQAFTQDSPLGIELGLKRTFPLVHAGTTFQWGEREITARAVLDISVEEDRIQQLELDINADWTVDLIEAVDATRVANYYVEETDDESSTDVRWIVPLRRAVAPTQPIRLIVQLRRPLSSDELSTGGNPAEKHRYQLSEFMPIHVLDGREGTQLIAFDSHRQYRRIAADDRADGSLSITRDRIRERFDEVPDGEVFSVGEAFRGDFLEIETIQPTYGMKVMTNLVMQNGYLFETCRFYCVPAANSRVGRLGVRFSPHTPATGPGNWTWSLGREPETSPQIRATKLAPTASFPVERGEIWDLELTPSRSTPFEVTATRVVPFDGTLVVPLPFFSEISQVDAFVSIETRDAIMYRVVKNPAHAVSPHLAAEFTAGFASSGIAPLEREASRFSSGGNLHAIRGVYHYEAIDRVFANENALFVLEPVPVFSATVGSTMDSVANSGTENSDRSQNGGISVDRMPDSLGNIWAMTLHSHYHVNGEVVSYAVLAVENRLLDHLKIALPPGVTTDDVRNVWIDRSKTTWSNRPPNGDRAEIVVPLPARQKNLTLIVEYFRQCDALSDHTLLEPSMPTFDIPVFTRKWYAWYPPQFRGFDTSDPEPRLPFGRDSTEFGLFSSRSWSGRDISSGMKNRMVACSRRMLHLLQDRDPASRLWRENANDPANAPSRDVPSVDDASASPVTWGELLSSNYFDDAISDAGNPLSPFDRFTLFIDDDSLVQAGFFPTTPVHAVSPTGPVATGDERGLNLLESHNLAVIFDSHHNMLLTTVTTVARFRRQLEPVYANHFWYCPGNVLEMNLSSDTTRRSVFLSPYNWQSDGAEIPQGPSIFNPNLPPEVFKPGWAAYEAVYDAEYPPSLLLTRKNTLLAHQLCVFFLILLASWRLPYRHAVWLIVLLVAVIILAGLFPFPLKGILDSAFWGLICAITFCLVRHLRSDRTTFASRDATIDQTTVIALRLAEDDSESGEVRSPAKFFRQPDMPFVPEPVGDTEIDSASSPADRDANEDATPERSGDSHGSARGLISPLWLLVACGLALAVTAGPVSGQVSGQSPASGYSNVSPLQVPLPENVREILESPNLPTPYRVFIPYDRQGKIGDIYYIPEKLYEELQHIERGTVTSGKWQITKARYVGTLMLDPVTNEVTLFNLRAIYDIELFDHSAAIRLPDMPLVPDGVRCDNQLLQPTVSPVVSPTGTDESNRNDYVFIVSGRGGHQVEVSLLPRVYDSQETSSRSFDFPIPVVPNSSLELTLPNSHLAVDVSPSFGQVSRLSDRLKADLGTTPRLSVSWSTRSSAPLNVSVSQYFKFHTGARETKLQASYRFSVSTGSIRQVLLAVDPRYRLEGSHFASEEIESEETVAGTENLRRITFRNPVTESVTVRAVYIPRNISGIGDFSGIGTLPLPRFSARDVRIGRSWLGVSSDPSTETELPLSNVEAKMFEDAWGGTVESVHHAYDLLRPQGDWFLSVRNRPVNRHVDQRQWLLLRNQSIVTYVEADVTPTYEKPARETTGPFPVDESVPVFFHEITLPDGFQYETVTVRGADGMSYATPRIECKDRDMVLFFKEPVSGKYVVSLFGSVACVPDEKTPFPLFGHGDRAAVSQSLFCYRDTSVLVQRSLVESAVRPIDAVPNPMPDFPTGYFLSAFRVESSEEFLKSTVSVKPNRPEIKGIMVSRLERNYTYDRWDMVITWDLAIAGGELDQVSIFIPVRLGSEIPAVMSNVLTPRQIQKNDGTLLELVPREPLSGEQFFGIRFPLGATLDTIAVPNVRLRHDCELEQYVALPERPANKSLNWSLANLVPTDFVPPIRPAHQRLNDPAAILVADTSMELHYYRVTGGDFSARITSSNESAVVLCHDAACFVKRDGFCFGVSVFDIQGNGATHCDIAFPAECQLMQLRLNDVSPLPERVAESTFRIELLSDVSVQRLTVTHCSRRQIAGTSDPVPVSTDDHPLERHRQMRLPLPFLVSVPVQKNLWEVCFEPPPFADGRIDVALDVNAGQETLTWTKEMQSLSRSEAGNLQIRMELVRLNQALTFLRMLSSPSPDGESLSSRQLAWDVPWVEKRQLAAHRLSAWNADGEHWENAFFFGRSDADLVSPDLEWNEWNPDMSFVEECVSYRKTPQLSYKELVDQYKTFAEGIGHPSTAGQESTVNADREFFMTNFWDDPARVRYVAGAVPYRMTEIRLTANLKTDSVLQGFHFHYAVWGAIFLAVLILAVIRKTRRLLQRFSILFIIVLIVFCRMFVAPNPIGWAVLLILLLAAVRIQWNQMRAATANVTRDRPPVITDDMP